MAWFHECAGLAGIDIGSLDVSIPPAIRELLLRWQRIESRRAQEWIVCRRAGRFPSTPLASVHRESPRILPKPTAGNGARQWTTFTCPISHLQCATFELPFRIRRTFRRSRRRFEILIFLPSADSFIGLEINGIDERCVSRRIRFRCEASVQTISLLSKPRRSIGSLESRLYECVFDTARKGDLSASGLAEYYVHQLDIPERRAYVRQVHSDYFTDAITYTKVKILKP